MTNRKMRLLFLCVLLLCTLCAGSALANGTSNDMISSDEIVLIDNEQIRIVVPAENLLEYNDTLGFYTGTISISNKTDTVLRYQGLPSTVNGYVIPVTTTTICPKTTVFGLFLCLFLLN